MAWNFCHSPSFTQGFDRHLLLDRGRVLAEVQVAQHRCSYRSKPVLTFAEPAFESPVDARSDERTAGETQELVKAAVQFTRSAAQARRDNVIGFVGQNGLDEQRDVLGIMGSISIEENRDWRADVWNSLADREALTAPGVGKHACSTLRSNVRRSVRRLSDHNEHNVRVAASPIDDAADTWRFLFGGNDDGHVGRDVMRRRPIQTRLRQRVREAGDIHCANPVVGEWSSAAVGRVPDVRRNASALPRMLWYASHAVQH